MIEPFFKTALGELYHGDCNEILDYELYPELKADLIFCDPPFNLNKQYGDHVDDNLSDKGYMGWLRGCLYSCVEALAPGGSIMVYNSPMWNALAVEYLMGMGLDFVDWIAVRVTGRTTASSTSRMASRGC